MEDKNVKMARRVAEEVRRAGGRCYYVGGYVRDRLLGSETKDIDIEVHGVPVAVLEGILDRLGARLLMGASFGILGLRGYEVDIAMPRSETATGRGHRDFEVSVDPFLGEEKAAIRRDFTMNALMEDVLTGEILDFFGGREDIARGVLRHVNDGTYLEDPLRVLRAAQFAARFGFTLDEKTRALSAGADLTALPGERIMGELEKALLKAEKPSIFFEELRGMNQLSVWFPELEALIGVEQNPAFHPEGDVWTHTMQVLDEAALLRDRAQRPLWFMLAALCHDFGKPLTTERIDGALHAYGHEIQGLTPVTQFIRRLTSEKQLLEYVRNLSRLHMEPIGLLRQRAGVKAVMRMLDQAAEPDDLLLLVRADCLGCCAARESRAAAEAAFSETEQELRRLLGIYRERMSRPCVMGRDLIEAGLKPGPTLGKTLDYVHKMRLAGVPKPKQLRQALGYARSLSREKGEGHD